MSKNTLAKDNISLEWMNYYSVLKLMQIDSKKGIENVKEMQKVSRKRTKQNSARIDEIHCINKVNISNMYYFCDLHITTLTYYYFTYTDFLPILLYCNYSQC